MAADIEAGRDPDVVARHGEMLEKAMRDSIPLGYGVLVVDSGFTFQALPCPDVPPGMVMEYKTRC